MKDKVALVTGASSGIGHATATGFAQRGAKVMVAARRTDELQQLVGQIHEAGGEAAFVQADVSLKEDVQRMVDETVKTFGALDYAVNNAGIEGTPFSFVDFEEDEWDKVMAINLRGNFLCIKYQAKAMLALGGGGAIVNVGSVNSFLGFAGGAAYATSKHGQVALTSSASAELAPQGIRVNIVCPGVIDTPMHQRLRGEFGDEGYDEILGKVHTRRAGRPEEIASTILFLCSDDASYITGATLTPDGGYMTTMG
jgi:NAD(P)-dependent dehydrogenase (short-subunit alcohol dehydrogenase family)